MPITTEQDLWDNEVEFMKGLAQASPQRLEEYVNASNANRAFDFFGEPVNEAFWNRFNRAQLIATGQLNERP